MKAAVSFVSLAWLSLVPTEFVLAASSPPTHSTCSPPGLRPAPGQLCSLEEGPEFAYDDSLWTHDVQCFYTTSNQESKLCLYTDANFKFGRGISIFTRPSIAANITGQYKFRHPEQLPEFLSPPAQPPYEQVELPGRGVGLFANRTIQRGEVIFVDTSVILLAREAQSSLPRSTIKKILWRALEQLPEPTQDMVFNLHRQTGGDAMADIMQTNGLGQVIGDGIRHLAIVPDAARINHDCRPNAYYRFDDKTMELSIIALRDIKSGEELTFTYIDPELPRDERRERLQKSWGFECSCSLCGASGDVVVGSDNRLELIKNTRKQMVEAASKPFELINHLEKLIDLYDQEGLHASKPRFYEIAAYTYSQLGDDKRALEHGKLAVEYWSAIAGKGSGEARRMREFVKDPKSHPSWRSA
ncbi:hypothetical protein BDY21DRAFT_345684 [Lineolata rhizophorae]|uniref:SET domain-containing protein n=1 Tax=Lineolata rhizophorae TaxID=578093 RepID=A0A6A6NYJ7_9PEZI|nr:hypothetical protein BDY21DRAFT_345684 [Lineolata rhizophorae]